MAWNILLALVHEYRATKPTMFSLLTLNTDPIGGYRKQPHSHAGL